MVEKTNMVIMGTQVLQGKLTDSDRQVLQAVEEMYQEALHEFSLIGDVPAAQRSPTPKLIDLYDRMGKAMQSFIATESRIHVYPFSQPRESHGEASRLIAKLRDIRTPHEEFVYYIQRAFELLFKMAYSVNPAAQRNHLMVETPVAIPVKNFAVHKLPNIDHLVHNCVMCVLLRGALLPSMIMSKEIQEYSSTGFITPFALFKIRRNELRQRSNMEYLLDLNGSYFDSDALHGKDLVFADPMNATGGSLVAVVEYLKSIGVRPRSIICFNAIAALGGALQIIRSVENAQVYTLWMDPVLNDSAYILPGLGDAGDRLNGCDTPDLPRNIIQLIADYGSNISNLYRAQVRQIERTVLGPRRV